MSLFILCLKIFFARIVDVSLGTIVTIIVIKGKKLFASIIGFIEILIWFLIVKEALNTLENSIWIAISYSLGFATGTYIGTLLSEIFISGTLGIQIVTSSENKSMIKSLKENGFGVTVLDIHDIYGKQNKYLLFLEIDKKRLGHLKEIISSFDPKAFMTVTESKYVQNGYFK